MSRLHLLRYVDGTSVLHRAGARSKVGVLIGLVFAFSFNPSWPAVAIVWTTLAIGIVVARLGFGVVPTPPKPLLAAIAISLVFGLLSGGEPVASLGDSQIELGGLILQLRLFAVTLGLLGLTLLLGWTTRASDLPTAASWLLRPLRPIGFPVDDVCAALTLAVRALPLVASEFATVSAMSKSEPPGRGIVGRGMNVMSTAAVATQQRGIEFGRSIEARGAIGVPTVQQPWNRSDAVVATVGLALVIAIVIVPGP